MSVQRARGQGGQGKPAPRCVCDRRLALSHSPDGDMIRFRSRRPGECAGRRHCEALTDHPGTHPAFRCSRPALPSMNSLGVKSLSSRAQPCCRSPFASRSGNRVMLMAIRDRRPRAGDADDPLFATVADPPGMQSMRRAGNDSTPLLMTTL
jgi:hypothetical protein